MHALLVFVLYRADNFDAEYKYVATYLLLASPFILYVIDALLT